jgi:glycosyltransferase involved in cell wall biosynthesis
MTKPAASVRSASASTTAVERSSDVTFSVIVPTYNESRDIEATLDAILAQDYARWELIVVDDGSTDDTVDVIARHSPHDALRLLGFRRNRGVSAARNAGIEAARCDVVVFVDADVTLPPDLLSRLARHYADGADLVSVESRVENRDSVFPRFIQADHEVKFGPKRRDAVGCSQGFSCRRELAAAARFPEEVRGGEDGEFVRRLRQGDVRWVRDFTIVVDHRQPDRLGAFWRQWRGRGAPVPYIDVRLRGRSLRTAALRRSAALARTLMLAALLVPNIAASVSRARKSPRSLRDLPAFWALLHLRATAQHVGEWRSLVRIWRERQGAADK